MKKANVSRKEKDKVRRIAYKVRAAFDKISKKEQRGYCSLIGYCARASAILSDMMWLAGIKHKIAYGDCHVYVEWKGYVVDVTATQFFTAGFGNTVIRTHTDIISYCKKHNSEWTSSHYETSKVFRDSLELLLWQEQEECEPYWPKSQLVNIKDHSYVI